jgi:tetratricopeptide (TPR) repeat protein
LKEYPSDTMVNLVFVPIVRARLNLQRRAPQQALEALQPAAPFGRAEFGMYGVLIRGRAYLMLKRPAEALAELQGLVDQRGNLFNFPIRVAAEVERARAFALQGDVARAREAFEHFLTAWRGADDDAPLLRQVKAEYAQLPR